MLWLTFGVPLPMQSLLCARVLGASRGLWALMGPRSHVTLGTGLSCALVWFLPACLGGRLPSCPSPPPAHPCALQTRLVASVRQDAAPAVPLPFAKNWRAGADRAYSRPAHFLGLPGFTECLAFQPSTGSGCPELSVSSLPLFCTAHWSPRCHMVMPQCDVHGPFSTGLGINVSQGHSHTALNVFLFLFQLHWLDILGDLKLKT